MPWDDAHHPKVSQTDGVPDGRWLFINGNNTPRIARLDLTKMETVETIEIPNSAGNHASPFVTPNSEYVVAATRFSVPAPQADVPIATAKENFSGLLSFVKVGANGEMSLAFQVRLPGYSYDLAHAGKGPSAGWAFFTTYNTEQAYTLLERGASQRDKDFIAAVNWKRAEECVAQGAGVRTPGKYAHNWVDERDIAVNEMKSESVVLEPSKCAGLVYFLPTPKSPHGVDVDPSGELIVAGGKLATVLPVHSFSKMQQAIAKKAFDGEANGIPILKYEATIAGEVPEPGLGPLHTEFDGKGFAYTSVFISSEIVKWSLKEFKVVDRTPTYYSIGHLMIPGGDSRKPFGKYVVALNKITKDRYLPTGPELTQSAQLYSIEGDKMRLLLDFPTVGEPHYAQAIPASLIVDKQKKSLRARREPRSGRDQVGKGSSCGPQGQRGARLHDVDSQPLHAGQHRGDPARRHGVLPHDQSGTGLGRAARLRDHRRPQLGAAGDAGADADARLAAGPRRRVPVLLHRLLLGPAPGDARLRARVAEGLGGEIELERAGRSRRRQLTAASHRGRGR